MRKLISVLTTILIPSILLAHEGHDKSPGAVAAPHGGTVQVGSQIILELVSKNDGVEIYAFDHDMKPLNTKDVKVEGKMSLPKKSKAEVLKFTAEGEAFAAKINAKGTHRYTLDLVASYAGKKEKIKFSVEPQ